MDTKPHLSTRVQALLEEMIDIDLMPHFLICGAPLNLIGVSES